jgi:glycosyltransferase involved in cell wall biosynthesis
MGLSFLLPRLIKKMYFRHIHTVHDVQLVEPSGIILKTKEKSWRYNAFPTKFYVFIMRKLFSSPEVVISPSTFLLDFYKARGFFPNSKFALLRNPITVDFEIREKELTPKLNFLYLGQVEKHKGVFLLLDVFLNLEQKFGEKINLYVAGAGSKLEELKNKYKQENIFFLGKVKRSELVKLFSKIDMLIVPSLCYENSPTVIFESLYAKIPVLASNIEGIAELIEEGENGITFEAGNPRDLEEKIIFCIQNKEKIKDMSKKVSSVLEEDNTYTIKLEEIYKD